MADSSGQGWTVTGPIRRRPAPGRPVPVTTYRVQLGPDLTFDDVRAHLEHLDTLGVTHVYLSPVLRAVPGSTHGYDVVDHREIAPDLGGRAGLDRLAGALRDRGMGLVVDIVPNHVAVPTPVWRNRTLWSVLALGPDSPYARWYDVDWSAGDGALLMPVLGRRIGAVLASGELAVETMVVPGTEDDGEQPVLRYHDHVFPVRPGTESLPLAELVARQHYRLAYWRVADEELNYRRFFDVGTLAAVRVEDPEVFDATHTLITALVADGTVDGLRIDHPDGLADPGGYLARLAEQTGGAWVAVEKILAADETLPADWSTVGTTGYDAMWRLHAVLLDPAGAAGLAALMHEVTGDAPTALAQLVLDAKREIVTGALYAEVHRVTDLAAEICRADVRLRDHTWRALHDCVVELLVTFDRYRAYVRPGTAADPEQVAVLTAAAQRARPQLAEDRGETLDLLVDLLLGREVGSAGRSHDPLRAELVVRFQQTCGAVLAKGVEDTAFYRWTHLVSLCEVGGAPERFAISPEELHGWAARRQQVEPLALTTLSTHDTKRSGDVRARLGVLSELAEEWAATVTALRTITAEHRPSQLDGRTENLLWQTLASTWGPAGPIAVDRLTAYVRKAVREAKTHTTWTAVGEEYEAPVLGFVERVTVDPQVREVLHTWAARTAAPVRAATLAVVLLHLTVPGVADVYQGTEVVARTLVDPDNRRPVDLDAIRARLADLDAGRVPRDLDDEKLWLTAQCLRARRAHPEAFVGGDAGYEPLPATTGHALAFTRTAAGDARVVAVATRLSVALERLGGWGEHTVVLPAGRWREELSGREWSGGAQRLATLLDRMPVALLVRVTEDS